ncbi:MAG: FAD-dependent monooxygenase [Planctomycetes bacterium]|nr:FAD-dependent monooxygenase [Planctomycetota bacterium]
MKINIIGAGPSALYFALLMKRTQPRHEIVIHERDGPNDTFGWGVVLPGKTAAFLEENDRESFEAITRAFRAWDNVDVVHRDQKISIHGNRFSGIARLAMLQILHRRCLDLGVTIRFQSNVVEADLERLADADLLVGADGANSVVRRHWTAAFEPTIDVRKHRYIWLGTNHLFHGLTLTFREADAGLFVAHSYEFNPTTSTFIVECTDATWKRAGFAGMSDAQTCETLAHVFAKDLGGMPLLSNNFVRWLNFAIVKNRRWIHDNVVLLGDALHTAHFSIGSGTKLALEDSVALFRAFEEKRDVPVALAEFERVRKPIVDEYQAAAHSSLLWFENAADRMHLDPMELAWELMTRSGRVDDAEVAKRDPAFAAAYAKWRAARAAQ